MKITNNGGGPEGIRDKSGNLVWLDPGQTRDIDIKTHQDPVEGQEQQLETPQFRKLKANPRFVIEGVERNFSPTIAQINAGTAPAPTIEGDDGMVELNADLQRNLQSANDQVETLEEELKSTKNDLTVAASRNTELQSQLDAKGSELVTVTSERDSLAEQVSQLTSALLELQNPFVPGHLDKVTVGLDARHKGGGSYSIWSGETEVLTGLTKVQTQEFDALTTDRAKTDWVNAQVKKD